MATKAKRTFSKEQKGYLLEEMKAARSRIDAEIKTMNQFETLSIGAIGATYGAFFSFKISAQAPLIFLAFITVLICVYGLFRYRAHADVVRIHEDYIKLRIESSVFGASERGLVQYYDDNKRSLLKFWRLVFWYSLIVVSLAILLFSICSPEKLASLHAGQR